MKTLRLSLLLLLAPAIATAQGLVSDLNVQRTVRFGTTTTGTINPAQITSNQNNYAPSGIASAFRVRISSDAARTITGLAAGQAGEIKVLTNIGTTYTITLADSSGSSTAANQFALAGDFQLLPDSAVPLEYDGTSQRWRIWGPTAAMLSGSFQPIDPALTALAGGSDYVVFSGPASSNKTFTLPNASATILTDNAAVTVAQGGTGRATGTTAYGLIAAGTTATGAQQTLSAGGTAQILVGGGPSALPIWTTVTGTGAPVRANSPALVTPDIGAATGTSLSLSGVLSGGTADKVSLSGVGASDQYFLAQNYVNDNGTESVSASGRASWRFRMRNATTIESAIELRAASAAASSWTPVVTFSSTGLSVTGALGVTGNFLSSAASPYFANDSATPGTFRIGSTAANTPVAVLVNNSIIGTFSSTGLAVTGAVSSTGTGNTFNYSGAGEGLSLLNTTDTSGSTFAAFRNGSAAVIGSVTRVTTTNAVAYNTTSDGRLKTNVRDFTAADSGPMIDRLRPRWFDWKASDLSEQVEYVDGDGKKKSKLVKVTDATRLAKHASDNKSIIGFIAQEEADVDDALVRAGAVTPGDSDPVTITKQWARSDAALVPILVAEVKALRARVAKLEAAGK